MMKFGKGKKLSVWSIIVAIVSVIFLSSPTPSYAAVTTNGNGGTTDVGMWFMTYNNSGMWANNFGHGFPINYRPLNASGGYSIPDSSDITLIDFYLQQLTNAKVDFILFDETNGGFYGTNYYTGNQWIIDNAKTTVQRINIWNQNHPWKIKYAFAIGTYGAMCGSDSAGLCAENQAKSVYNNFVTNGNYYKVNGKPLLVLYDWANDTVSEWNNYTGDKTYGNYFTIRSARGGEAGTYGWQTSNGTQVNSEVEVVSPGWNNHNGSSYSRNKGQYYNNAWNTVFSNPLPRIVMITSFNDYNEDSAVWTADTGNCDNANEERWYGTDNQLHPSMYWDTTVSNIAKLRNNLAQGGGVTTSSSAENWGFYRTNLVDGNYTSAWSSWSNQSSNHTEWVEINLGSSKTFSKVVLVPRNDLQDGFPIDFQIQVWNGSTWLTRVSQTNYAKPDSSPQSFTWGFSDTTSKIRVVGTNLRQVQSDGYLMQLGDIQVYP